MYVTKYEPPEKRRSAAEGGIELRLTEAAVMLAFAMHLLEQPRSSGLAQVHPDGEHAKIFDIVGFLTAFGFRRSEVLGATAYGGRYIREDRAIVVQPASGRGDVVGEVDGRRVLAECKGGVIDTRHPGQKSRLRRGLSELIGQLMLLPANGVRQVAVLPRTADTLRSAQRLAPRCLTAGIEIALVDAEGRVAYIQSDGDPLEKG